MRIDNDAPALVALALAGLTGIEQDGALPGSNQSIEGSKVDVGLDVFEQPSESLSDRPGPTVGELGELRTVEVREFSQHRRHVGESTTPRRRVDEIDRALAGGSDGKHRFSTRYSHGVALGELSGLVEAKAHALDVAVEYVSVDDDLVLLDRLMGGTPLRGRG